MAGPALFFILGREGQVPSCLNHMLGLLFERFLRQCVAGIELGGRCPVTSKVAAWPPPASCCVCVWAAPGSVTNKSHLW